MSKIWETISAAPAEAWVGLIGVIFGSLLAILTAWLTSRANRKQMRTQLEHEEKMHRQRVSKERLEELYVQVTHWSNALFADTLSLTLVMEGHHSYNQYLDAVIEDQANRKDSLDFSRLEMIVKVYGGAVQVAFNHAIVARAKINDVKAEHKSAYLKQKSGKPFLKLLMDAQEELSVACDNLKADIAKAARDA